MASKGWKKRGPNLRKIKGKITRWRRIIRNNKNSSREAMEKKK